MPTTKTKEVAKEEGKLPKTLEGYAFHGVELDYDEREDEAPGVCPFCSKEKFSVNIATGQWKCWSCGGGSESGGGGIFDFLRLLWEASDKATGSTAYNKLTADRSLEFADTLVHWGVCQSIITGEWLVPAHALDTKGKLRLQQLYRYVRMKDRMLLLPVPGLKHGLFGVTHYDEVKPDIYLCEGPWDAIRLWEAMKSTKIDAEGNLSETGNVDGSLLGSINVLATPGTMVFPVDWIPKWFRGKTVNLLYDNDHAKIHPKTGNKIEGGALTGMKLVSARLAGSQCDIFYTDWGPEGYDPNLPHGYDVRDQLKNNRLEGLAAVLNRLHPIPQEWVSKEAVATNSGGSIQCTPCTNWNTLINGWKRAMKWTDGLDHAFAFMLACVASTKSVGDQLWGKLIGPASCGKSTLCEAISVNKQYVVAKSTLRGFHSGYRETGSDKEDNSLIVQVKDKTLVTKDGDTILQAPNIGQILSEARDLYDSVSRTSYRNKASKDYEGIRMTWIIAGTSSLRALDKSELGARFLDCVIMHKIDEELEEEILWRVANKASDHVDLLADGESKGHHSPELVNAMELSGGYVTWLRENAPRVLPTIEFSNDAKRKCLDVGKFVAYMRARPSEHQKENAERELAARLVSQHVRLAKCLALVLNQPAVTDAVMARVRRVGLDTARGVVLDLTKALYESGEQGMEATGLLLYVNCTRAELGTLLRFLRAIGVVENFNTKTRKAWRVTMTISDLYGKVVCGIYEDTSSTAD